MKPLISSTLFALGTISVLMAQTPLPARLIVLDPGHFHATLLQREMYPELDKNVSVYAKLGPELLDYLNRISLFNNRKESPTNWQLKIETSNDPMGKMLRDKPGNVVLFTGRNRGKIDRVTATLESGLNALVDKPWIIESNEMTRLEQALNLADRKGLVAYDIMTERYEVTSQVQQALVHSPELFGELEKGTRDNPAIRAKSIHYVMKVVAGVPLRRPVWFFDTAEYGEALADVGTHVVDLVQWIAFPDQAIDYRKDIQVLAGKSWPLELTKAQFQQVTSEPEFPANLSKDVHGEILHYRCNNSVDYTIRGSHVKLDILWDRQATEGGDVYENTFRGTKSRIEVRQGKAEGYTPEIYVVPVDQTRSREAFEALRKRIAGLQTRWPGLAFKEQGTEARITIPSQFRVSHEAHFAQVTRQYFEYLKAPKSMKPWEKANMLAKYYITTKGVELGRTKGSN